MFCRYCGTQIPDGSAFCASCGANLQQGESPAAQPQQPEYTQQQEPPAQQNFAEQEPVQQNFAEQEPVQQNFAEQEPPAQPPRFATADFNNANPAPKKKKKGLIISLVSLATAAAVAVGLFFGFSHKNFASAAEYFRHVESNGFDESVETLAGVYGKVIDAENFDSSAVSTSLKINVGDKAASLLQTALEESTGTDVDLKWLDTIVFDIDVNAKQKIAQAIASLNINNKEIVGADVILDMDKGQIFLGLLSLTEKYLVGDLDELTDVDMDDFGIFDPASMFVNTPAVDDITKYLPKQETLDELLNKYFDIALKNITDVEKSSETVIIGDVEQKLTVLTVSITEQDLLNIVKDILIKAKTDEDIKKVIESVSDFLVENGVFESSDNVYADFVSEIDSLLEELDEVTPDTEALLSLTDYVNKKDKIVGRKVSVMGEELLDMALVRDGKNFACKLDAAGLSVSGNGTEDNDIINAEISAEFNGQDIAQLTITDFNSKSDYLVGKFTIAPSKDIFELIGLDSSVASVLSITDPALELNFENSNDKSKMDFNIVGGKEVFVGFTVTSELKKAEDIKKPSDDKTTDDPEEWASSIDFQKIIDALDEALPFDIAELYTNYILSSYDYDDSYDYDSYLDEDYSYDEGFMF